MSEEQTAEVIEAPEVVSTEAPAPSQDRPEWLPEKFNDPAELGKAYKSLESKLGEKEEDIRNRVMEELKEKSFENVPKSAGEYELPDFINNEEAADNPLLKEWADHCHENGYTHSEFQRGLEMYKSAVGVPPNIDDEAKKLGDNSHARIEAASLFAEKFFPKESLSAVERMCETAEGIIALEAIQKALRDPSMAIETNVTNSMDTKTLQEMMRDERYWNPARRDSNFVKEVDAGFKKLYG